MIALLAAAALYADAGPFSIQGRFVDLAPEGTEWAMPPVGADVRTSFTSADSTGGTSDWNIKTSSGPIKLHAELKLSSGTVSGSVKIDNTTKTSLDGVRFDIAGAIETYMAKDKDGKDITLTRSQSVSEDSPLLYGDMLDGEKGATFAIKGTGLAWKPETKQIDLILRVSGYMFQRSLFKDHAHSYLAIDHKGRLLVSSAQQQAIYRANLQSGELESVASTPDFKCKLSVNMTDGTITYAAGEKFYQIGPGGQDKGTIDQVDDVRGMVGWPAYSGYDAKGRLYVMFGNAISQLTGSRPSFTLTEASGFQFADYSEMCVAPDGSIFVGTGSSVFRFSEGGKNPKKLVQGVDWRPGRIHGIEALTYDDATKTIWVGSDTEDEFHGRVDAFDANGRFLFTMGRGAYKAPDSETKWPSQCPFPCSIAVAPNGNVYVANYDSQTAVQEFAPIKSE